MQDMHDVDVRNANINGSVGLLELRGWWRGSGGRWISLDKTVKINTKRERGGYAKEEICCGCLKEVSSFISLQSCNFTISPTFNGLNGLQVEWQVLFNAHFDVLIPHVDIFFVPTLVVLLWMNRINDCLMKEKLTCVFYFETASFAIGKYSRRLIWL